MMRNLLKSNIRNDLYENKQLNGIENLHLNSNLKQQSLGIFMTYIRLNFYLSCPCICNICVKHVFIYMPNFVNEK